MESLVRFIMIIFLISVLIGPVVFLVCLIPVVPDAVAYILGTIVTMVGIFWIVQNISNNSGVSTAYAALAAESLVFGILTICMRIFS